MKSGDRTKMRRRQALAAQARREVSATTDAVSRQQLIERAGKHDRAARNAKTAPKSP